MNIEKQRNKKRKQTQFQGGKEEDLQNQEDTSHAKKHQPKSRCSTEIRLESKDFSFSPLLGVTSLACETVAQRSLSPKAKKEDCEFE